MAVIHSLKYSAFSLIGERAVIHCLSISSSSTMLTSKKQLVPSMRSLKVNYNYLYRILSATILSTVLHIFLLKSAVIHFYQRIFFKRISEHQSR